MIIYVYKQDYSSYSSSPNAWGGDVLPVEVPEDFSGGNKTYNPLTGDWVTNPPYVMTEEELKIQFEAERTELLAESNRVTADWRTELLLDEISDEDRVKLSAWLAYNRAVKNTKYGEEWPTKPE